MTIFQRSHCSRKQCYLEITNPPACAAKPYLSIPCLFQGIIPLPTQPTIQESLPQSASSAPLSVKFTPSKRPHQRGEPIVNHSLNSTEDLSIKTNRPSHWNAAYRRQIRWLDTPASHPSPPGSRRMKLLALREAVQRLHFPSVSILSAALILCVAPNPVLILP